MSTDYEALTQDYLNAAAEQWRTIDNGHVPLRQVFCLLQALPGQKHRLPSREENDLASLEARRQNAGLGAAGRPECAAPMPSREEDDLTPLEARRQNAGLGAAGRPECAAPLLSREEDEEVRRKNAGLGAVGRPKCANPMPLEQVLQQNRHLVIKGEPGAGKSTTLQYIALALADPKAVEQPLALPGAPVPVRVDLRQVAGTLSDAHSLLEDCLALRVNAVLGKADANLSRELVEEWCTQNRLCVLLDGLDEVPADQLREVRRQVNEFCRSPLRGSDCRVVLASRPAGFASLGEPFAEFMLKPFEKKEEIQAYLQRWLQYLTPCSEDEAQKKAGILHDALKEQRGLKNILDNPLILRLAVQVYVDHGEIARSRVALYESYFERQWQKAADLGVDATQKEGVLQRLEKLGFDLQMRREGLFPKDQPALQTIAQISEAEEEILRRRLGLVVKAQGEWVFSHTTFQEYFAARYLKRAWQEQREGCKAFMKPRLHLPVWRETLDLMAGLMHEKQRDELAQWILHAGSPQERLLRRDLCLALSLAQGRVNREALAVCQKLIRRRQMCCNEPRKRIYRIWGSFIKRVKLPRYSPHIEIIEKMVSALGESADPMVVGILKLALQDEDKWVRSSAAEALGKMGGKEVVNALIQLLQDEDAVVRSSAAEAPGEIGGKETVRTLEQALQNKNSQVRCSAARALGKMGGKEVVNALIQLLQGEDAVVRSSAAEALGEIGDAKAVSALVQALQNIDYRVYSSAAEALGKIGGKEAVSALVQALQNIDYRVRCSAAAALGQTGDAKAVSVLSQALRGKNIWVRRSAAEALGKIGGKEAVSALAQALQDEDEWVRRSAAEALAKIGDAKAIGTLSQALRGKNLWVRRSAAEALGDIGVKEAIGMLAQVLRDEDKWVHLTAVKNLGTIGDAKAVCALAQALQDESKWTRCSAAVALGKIGDAKAVDALVYALQDENKWTRCSAADALGEIGNTKAVGALVQALQDEETKVCFSAAAALGKMGGADAVNVLMQMLQDEDESVRHSATAALGEMGGIEAIIILTLALRNRKIDDTGSIKKAIDKVKIPDDEVRRRQLGKLLKKVERIVIQHSIHANLDIELLEILHTRLIELEILEKPRLSRDPNLPPERFSLPAWTIAGLLLFALVFLTGLAGIIVPFSNVITKAIEDIWGTTIVDYAQNNPHRGLAILFGFSALAGLVGVVVTWLAAELKKRLSGKSSQ